MANRSVSVGIFVVGGLALFTLGTFLIGDQHKSFARHFEVYTEFTNLDGLAKGAKVQVSGMDAGQIIDIGVPTRPGSKFRIKLRIEQRLHPLIRTDSIVTIDTEGVVGDKFLFVHQGGPNSEEAGPLMTLPSKEPLDLSDVMERGAGLLTDVNSMIKETAGKLNGALDTVTKTVNNTDDIVIGLKKGRGPVGMLLRDEDTADRLRQTIENTRQATSSLRHASTQADAMVSDLQSRRIGQKADDAMVSAKDAAQNIDAASRQLQHTLTAALGPDEHGGDAATNIGQSLSNLNLATGNMAEDTEALKHNFFFRGFFKHRGYYNLSNLKPDQYRQDRLFSAPTNRRQWFTNEDLFQTGSDGVESLSVLGEERIDGVATQLADAMVSRPVVVEGYAPASDQEEQFAKARNRAILVSQYLQKHLHLDPQNVGFVSLQSQPPSGVQKDHWDGICLVILK